MEFDRLPVTLHVISADIAYVSWVTGSPSAPTWLYTRGGDSVRIEIRDQGSEFELVVSGPGGRKRFLQCTDPWAVIECQIAEETHLLALGFTLERFTTNRRRNDRTCERPVRARKNPSGGEETRS